MVIWLLCKDLEKYKYSVDYVYAKINNLKQYLLWMALLENNVRRISIFYISWKEILNYFAKKKITQIHATITLEDDIIKMMALLKLSSCLFLC